MQNRRAGTLPKEASTSIGFANLPNAIVMPRFAVRKGDLPRISNRTSKSRSSVKHEFMTVRRVVGNSIVMEFSIDHSVWRVRLHLGPHSILASAVRLQCMGKHFTMTSIHANQITHNRR